MTGRLQAFSSTASRLIKIGFAGFSAATVASFTKSAFQAADELVRLAKVTDIGISELSRLAYAAQQSDVELSTLASSLGKLQRSLGDAERGSKSVISALDELGLSMEELAGLPLDQQFARIAGRIAQISDSQRQAAIASDLFGRSVDDLLPLLREGEIGIKRLLDESDRIGATMSRASAEGIEVFDSALKRLKATLSGFWTRAMGGLALAILGPEGSLEKAAMEVQALERMLDPSKQQSAWDKLLTTIYSAFSGGDLKEQLEEAKRKLKELQEIEALGVKTTSREHARRIMERQREWMEAHEKRLKLIREQAERERQIKEDIERGWIDAYLDIERRARDQVYRDIEESAESAAEHLNRTVQKSVDALDELQREAIRDLQDALSDLFYTMDGNLRSFFKRVVDTMRRLLADKLAQILIEAIFKRKKQAQGGTTGGLLEGFLGFLFGGGRALGGPVSAGKAYLINERGPEYFVPSTSGRMVPANKMASGGVVYSPTYNFSGTTQELEAFKRYVDEKDRQTIANMAQLIRGGAFA
ncbi:MAG: hypothetical protein RML32_04100 [Gammaproteobacteria bacterium]|nr:hypothetical protein [Gammaproteobacteria bacterium]